MHTEPQGTAEGTENVSRSTVRNIYCCKVDAFVQTTQFSSMSVQELDKLGFISQLLAFYPSRIALLPRDTSQRDIDEVRALRARLIDIYELVNLHVSAYYRYP
jgi:hypothetical protein